MTQTKSKKQIVNTDEVVTRRILIEEFNRLFDEKFDEKFRETESNLQRYMGALSEDFTHKVQMLAEGIAIQIEANERKWQEQGGLNGFLEKRISRLESQIHLV